MDTFFDSRIRGDKESVKDRLFRITSEIFTLSIEVIYGKKVSELTPEEFGEISKFESSEIEDGGLDESDGFNYLNTYFNPEREDENLLALNKIREKEYVEAKYDTTKENLKEKYLDDNGDYKGWKDYYNEKIEQYLAEKDDFVGDVNEIRQSLYDLCSKINKKRHKGYGHAKNPTNYILTNWCTELEEYIVSFLKYLKLLDGCFVYEKEVFDRYNQDLEDIFEDILILYQNAAKDKDAEDFEFMGKHYSISKNPDCEFPLLIVDMLKNWDAGVLRICNDKEDEFRKILKLYYYDNSYKVDKYEDIKKDLVKSYLENYEQLKNSYYCKLMNTIYPLEEGDSLDFYWCGKRYSESYFASLVLQTLVRHTGKYSFEDKMDYLVQQIEKLRKGTVSRNNNVKISVFALALAKVLSNYYDLQGLEEGKNKAEKFEESLMNFYRYFKDKDNLSAQDYKKEYDDLTGSGVWDLLAYMKKNVTYLLPYYDSDLGNGSTFNNMESLKDYIKRYVVNHSIDDSTKRLRVIYDDNSFKCFAKLEGIVI